MEKLNSVVSNELNHNQSPISDQSASRQGQDPESHTCCCPDRNMESEMNEESQNVPQDDKQKDQVENKSGKTKGRNSTENNVQVQCPEIHTDDCSSQSCDLLPGLRYAIPFLSKKLKSSLIQRLQPCSGSNPPTISSDEDSDEQQGVFSSVFFPKQDKDSGNCDCETNQNHLCDYDDDVEFQRNNSRSYESQSDDFEEYPPSAYRLFDERSDISEQNESYQQDHSTDDDKSRYKDSCDECENAEVNSQFCKSSDIECVLCNMCSCNSNTDRLNFKSMDCFEESKDRSNECCHEVPGKYFFGEESSDHCDGGCCMNKLCDFCKGAKRKYESCRCSSQDTFPNRPNCYDDTHISQRYNGYKHDGKKCDFPNGYLDGRHEVTSKTCSDGDENMALHQSIYHGDQQRCKSCCFRPSDKQTWRPSDDHHRDKQTCEPSHSTCSDNRCRCNLNNDDPQSDWYRYVARGCEGYSIGDDDTTNSSCATKRGDCAPRKTSENAECADVIHLNTYTGPPRSISDIITDLQQIDLIDCFLSDNEGLDDNKSVHSSESFLEPPYSNSSSDNGEADDEFECDCQHCQLMRSRSPAEGQNHESHISLLPNLNWQPLNTRNEFNSRQLDLGVLHNDWVSDSEGEEYRYEGSSEPLEEFVYDIQQEMEEGFERMITEMLLLHPELLADTAPPPAAGDVIDSLPKTPVAPPLIDEDQSCPICMGAFVIEEIMSTLPCGHIFHNTCVKAWLNKSGTCPVCRRRI